MEEKSPIAYRDWKENKKIQDDSNQNSDEAENKTLTQEILNNGEVRSKDDCAFECIGLVDELNANVGIAICLLKKYDEVDLFEALETIQCRLVDVQNHIGAPRNDKTDDLLIKRTVISEEVLTELAKIVDLMDYQLPRLTQFILPGGSLVASQLHICRTVSRRVERNLVPLLALKEVDDISFKFMNRLSDFFYVAARYMCKVEGSVERLYRKGNGIVRRTMEKDFEKEDEVDYFQNNDHNKTNNNSNNDNSTNNVMKEEPK